LSANARNNSKDSDEPAFDGEPGRIVVSDLFNHALPLIRYNPGKIRRLKETAECNYLERSN
jgi:phenylacetate-CoA ligase